MKKIVLTALVAIVATVVILYIVVPGPPIYQPDPVPVVDQTDVDADDSTAPVVPPTTPATAAPSPATSHEPTAVEYGAMLKKMAVKQAELIAKKDTLAPEAKALVEALPPPPPPTGNCADDASPDACHWPTPESLEEWKDNFDTAAQHEAGKKDGEGLFALLKLGCPIGAAAAGVPPESALSACEMLLPLLDGLGLSLGEGDDIQEAVQALQDVQNGNYSKLKDYAANHPETLKRIPEMMQWIEQIDPEIRQRFAGVDLNDTGVCDIVLGRLAEAAAGELDAATHSGVGRRRVVMERLAGTIKDPAIRVRVQNAIAGDLTTLSCPP